MFGNFIYLYLASHQHQVSTKHDIGLGSSTGGNRGGGGVGERGGEGESPLWVTCLKNT